MRASLFAPLLVLAMVGCASPITEIVVEVGSDLSVPSALDGLVIDVMRDGGGLTSSSARLGPGEPSLPRTLTLVHRGGALGPIDVEVRGTLGTTDVVSARRVVSFVTGRTVRLRIELTSACASASCLAPLTCGNDGRCRDPLVRSCELEGIACEDAGAVDAGSLDVGSSDVGPLDAPIADGGSDAGSGCVLDAGLCVPESAMLGDTVALAPCTPPAGVTISYETRAPEGSTMTGDTIRVDGVGTYTVTATASAPSACTAVHTIRVDPFALAPSASRPSDVVRDLAARPGMAFVATGNGPWAVTRDGWRDLRTGAAGVLPFTDLQAVVVREGEAFFGGSGDQRSVLRMRVASDFSLIEVYAVTIPDPGDRSMRVMAVPPGADESGDVGPIALGTREGVLLLTGEPDSLVASARGTNFDIAVGLAIGSTEPADRGAIWAIDDRAGVRNVATGAGAPFAGGGPVALTPTAIPRAIALDDRGASPRLIVCSEDTGIQLYDLDIDWSARTTLPAPVAALTSLACRDVALGEEGDFWAATATGLFRIEGDGTIRSRPAATDGIGATPLEHVATAWDTTTREVWVMTTSRDVLVVAADPR